MTWYEKLSLALSAIGAASGIMQATSWIWRKTRHRRYRGRHRK